MAVAPEDSRAENPVTTVTVFSRFTVFHVKNTWAGDGGLEKLHRLFFFGLGGTCLRSPCSQLVSSSSFGGLAAGGAETGTAGTPAVRPTGTAGTAQPTGMTGTAEKTASVLSLWVWLVTVRS